MKNKSIFFLFSFQNLIDKVTGCYAPCAYVFGKNQTKTTRAKRHMTSWRYKWLHVFSILRIFALYNSQWWKGIEFTDTNNNLRYVHDITIASLVDLKPGSHWFTQPGRKNWRFFPSGVCEWILNKLKYGTNIRLLLQRYRIHSIKITRSHPWFLKQVWTRLKFALVRFSLH